MYTFIDLFAGIGGTRTAFENAGGTCVLTSEWDKFCMQTYAANFNTNHMLNGDIRTLKIEDIPEFDVLVGGFPCQPFSISGLAKRRSVGKESGFLDQTQGTLFFEIAKILLHRRPKAFLLENVKNLLAHDKGQTFNVIYTTLTMMGYQVSYEVIDAKPWVPQHRERIYIVGSLDAKIPLSCLPIPSRSPILDDVLLPDSAVDPKYTLSDRLWASLQAHAAKHAARGNGFGFGIADRNGVSRTLTSRYYKDGSEILIEQTGKNPRRLTPREAARLMGFPDSFVIPVSDTQAYKQFGNSVAVPLVTEIAKRVAASLPQSNVVPLFGENVVQDAVA